MLSHRVENAARSTVTAAAAAIGDTAVATGAVAGGAAGSPALIIGAR